VVLGLIILIILLNVTAAGKKLPVSLIVLGKPFSGKRIKIIDGNPGKPIMGGKTFVRSVVRLKNERD
jgi:hypothetical protein